MTTAHGVNHTPRKLMDFLPFGTNAEMGAAKSSMFIYDYWVKSIQDRAPCEYSAISGYNTGSENFVRAFTDNTMQLEQAATKTISMEADGVFDHLRSKRPYAETCGYLLQISIARRFCKAFSYPNS